MFCNDRMAIAFNSFPSEWYDSLHRAKTPLKKPNRKYMKNGNHHL